MIDISELTLEGEKGIQIAEMRRSGEKLVRKAEWVGFEQLLFSKLLLSS
jgi:hypothetical protein